MAEQAGTGLARAPAFPSGGGSAPPSPGAEDKGLRVRPLSEEERKLRGQGCWDGGKGMCGGRGPLSSGFCFSCSHFPHPGSFLPGAAEARGTWDVFMEAASSEGPRLSHRTGRPRPLPPFTGPSSLTDQSGFTLPSSPAACTAGLWPKGARAHLISACVSPLEASGECSYGWGEE